MDVGFPKLIADAWNGIPDNMDAAFSLNNIGKTGKNSWLVKNEVLILSVEFWLSLPYYCQKIYLKSLFNIITFLTFAVECSANTIEK